MKNVPSHVTPKHADLSAHVQVPGPYMLFSTDAGKSMCAAFEVCMSRWLCGCLLGGLVTTHTCSRIFTHQRHVSNCEAFRSCLAFHIFVVVVVTASWLFGRQKPSETNGWNSFSRVTQTPPTFWAYCTDVNWSYTNIRRKSEKKGRCMNRPHKQHVN